MFEHFAFIVKNQNYFSFSKHMSQFVKDIRNIFLERYKVRIFYFRQSDWFANFKTSLEFSPEYGLYLQDKFI